MNSRRRSALLAAVVLLSAVPAAFAQLGARTTEQWLRTLDSAQRVAKLKVDEAVAVLRLAPGAVVADIGAGSGTFTLPLARAVGDRGRIYAVEIEAGLVEHIARRTRENGTPQVQAILGGFTDPKLPARDVDVAFIFDVLHHIEKRPEYLRALVGYLKAGGRIAVIDFHPELGPHRDDPALQVPRAQCDAWFAALGFFPVAIHPLYTDKWYVEYARRP